jgi:citrate lyase beta subunit
MACRWIENMTRVVGFDTPWMCAFMDRDCFNCLQNFTLADGAEKAVRINAVGSGLHRDDLEAMCNFPRQSLLMVSLASTSLKAIVVPKVESAAHIWEVINHVYRLAVPSL